MGLIDVVCIVFLIVWALLGFRRGFLFEILTALVAVSSIVIAYLVHPMLLDIAGRFVNYNANLERIIFLISFVIVMIIIQMLTIRIVTVWSEVMLLGIFLRILGIVAAVPRGAFYLGTLLWLIVAFSPDSVLTKRINEAIMTNHMKNVVVVVYNSMDNILRKEHISPFVMKEFLK